MVGRRDYKHADLMKAVKTFPITILLLQELQTEYNIIYTNKTEGFLFFIR